MHVKGAHFMKEDIGMFDAAFFNYSAETAAVSQIPHGLQVDQTERWLLI
jgi:hypothetical protein